PCIHFGRKPVEIAAPAQGPASAPLGGAVVRKRSAVALLPARRSSVLGVLGARSFELTLCSTLRMTRRARTAGSRS
ncbi:hypothetical protein, partial [Klebsiella quasipneumoniae]|uniref:hypothetical protein n=1 Tax=Klebsiella quasipneumoniae TaxID=1463165 RepID=UPI0027308AE6